MHPTRFRPWLLLTALTACQDPTQITVLVTTNARCPGDGPGDAILDSAGISAARDFPPGEAATFNARRDFCDGPRTVGSLVLVPAEGRDDNLVEVLIVGGFETDDGKAPQTAESCEETRAAAGIAGLNCVVARRRLGFVEHTPLTLPIDLDTRCLGVECGEDLTCFQGECVDPQVDCDANGDCILGEDGGGGSGAGGSGGAPGGGGSGGAGGGPTTELCANGMDDDGDTFADCLDDECANTLFCAAPASLVLNEVSIRSADQAEEFIEVYNRGDAPVDLTGAVVSLLEGPAGGASTPYAAIALDGLSLQPGEYLLLHDAGLVAPPGVVSLPFDGAADTDHLRQTEETGAIALHVSGGGLVDALVYDGLPSFLLVEDVSYAPTNYFVPVTESATTPDSLARIPNGELGSPDSIWRVTTSVTLGDANQVSAGTEDCTNGVDDDDPDTDVDCADAECDGAACGANGVECLAGTCSCPGGLLEDDCTNGVDDDCDGDVDCADPSCGGTPACAEICGNGIDDLDDDPDVDCADSECAGTPACAEICDNGVDDADLDLDVDCADSECALGTLCQEICTNGVDDADVDALADCADPECAGLPYCDEICTNGIDDPDVDGLADCADPECAGLPYCDEICDNGVDDPDVDALTDCADPECDGQVCAEFGRTCSSGVCECPTGGMEACNDGVDNDCDGLEDCADPSCGAFCGEICSNGIDDTDPDLLVDCQDTVDCPNGASCGPYGEQCAGGLCLCPGSVEVCDDGVDNDCNMVADCADPGCDLSMFCVEDCTNGVDDDGDGAIDCADVPSCESFSCGPNGLVCLPFGACGCPGMGIEICDNNVDDDCDGGLDCADSSCVGAPNCGGSVNVIAVNPQFATIAGRVELTGFGFLQIEEVWIGNVPQPNAVVVSDTLIRIDPIIEGTQLGESDVTLFGQVQMASFPGPTVIDLKIQELDARNASPDLDFLQLQTEVSLTIPLNGYVVAFFDGDGPGGSNVVSHSFPLSGSTTFDGTYLVAGTGLSPVQQPLPFVDIPSGTDAVAIYQAASPLMIGAAPPANGLIDALVFQGPNTDPAPSLTPQFMLTPATINEGAMPNSLSMQRCSFERRDAAAFQALPPTPFFMGMNCPI